MQNCHKEEIIKRQIAILREVSNDIATRLEKATGVKGYDGIANLRFNGSHNGMSKDASLRAANNMEDKRNKATNNGAPVVGQHQKVY